MKNRKISFIKFRKKTSSWSTTSSPPIPPPPFSLFPLLYPTWFSKPNVLWTRGLFFYFFFSYRLRFEQRSRALLLCATLPYTILWNFHQDPPVETHLESIKVSAASIKHIFYKLGHLYVSTGNWPAVSRGCVLFQKIRFDAEWLYKQTEVLLLVWKIRRNKRSGSELSPKIRVRQRRGVRARGRAPLDNLPTAYPWYSLESIKMWNF